VSQRIALVIDALSFLGGAEKVLSAAMELFPSAPIYTLVYDPAAFRGTPFACRRVIPSPVDRLPKAQRYYRSYFPLLPLAIGRFDLSGYDTVLSFSYAVAHGVRTRSDQRHLSYTFTPLRYAWQDASTSFTGPSPAQWLARRLMPAFRRWDAAAAARIDRLAAVSSWTAGCIRQAYRREAQVIYPPVDTAPFRPCPPRGDYFITVTRLFAHKRVDLIVEAFTKLGLPLVVIGAGPEGQHLAKIAGPNVHLLGYQPDQALAAWLGRARAFVCAAEEDFGIAMIEAQAAGCPLIAYYGGGAAEIICEDQTGLFFQKQTVDSLVQAVQRFERLDHAAAFDPAALQSSARRFSKDRFQRELAAFIAQP
jgi:glycosyltransferase involved in cell wall biosynthesis